MAIMIEVQREAGPADAVIVPAIADGPSGLGSGETGDIGHDVDDAYLRTSGFTGQIDQVAVVPGSGGQAVIVVGLGPESGVDAQVIRRASAIAVRAAAPYASVTTHLLDALPASVEPVDRLGAAQALAEGAVLGAYRFDRYKSDSEPPALARLTVVSTGGERLQEALDLGARIGTAVCLARDLINEPGGTLTPTRLAEVAGEIAEREGLDLTVIDRDELAERGFGGLLGVNRGSFQPPKFIRLSYAPAEPEGHLALVGKGITFDSGGLSIKSSEGMMTMKDDMGGAAAILGAMSAMAAVAPKCRVTAYIPATDNMTGPDATRPGDVLRMYGGTTVEVLDTDAEGRLVLGDALALATEEEPDAIVDLATLTGAAISALGSKVAALMSPDEPWSDQIKAAAERVGERVWPLPLVADYRAGLDSEIADLRNISRVKEAGAITAGLFLQEFVGDDIWWAHLDVAGPVWSDSVSGDSGKGGTGYGVRLLLELARAFRTPR